MSSLKMGVFVRGLCRSLTRAWPTSTEPGGPTGEGPPLREPFQPHFAVAGYVFGRLPTGVPASKMLHSSAFNNCQPTSVILLNLVRRTLWNPQSGLLL